MLSMGDLFMISRAGWTFISTSEALRLFKEDGIGLPEESSAWLPVDGTSGRILYVDHAEVRFYWDRASTLGLSYAFEAREAVAENFSRRFTDLQKQLASTILVAADPEHYAQILVDLLRRLMRTRNLVPAWRRRLAVSLMLEQVDDSYTGTRSSIARMLPAVLDRTAQLLPNDEH
jgi:hypothetical protein